MGSGLTKPPPRPRDQALVVQVREFNNYVVGEACVPDKLPCPYGTSPLHTIAGHFRYMHAREALVARNGLPPDTHVPCLTYIRKPVERLVSFYYWMLHERESKVRLGGVGGSCATSDQ
jgi:hypothetical protein